LLVPDDVVLVGRTRVSPSATPLTIWVPRSPTRPTSTGSTVSTLSRSTITVWF
jgi:hypothetical protein